MKKSPISVCPLSAIRLKPRCCQQLFFALPKSLYLIQRTNTIFRQRHWKSFLFETIPYGSGIKVKKSLGAFFQRSWSTCPAQFCLGSTPNFSKHKPKHSFCFAMREKKRKAKQPISRVICSWAEKILFHANSKILTIFSTPHPH